MNRQDKEMLAFILGFFAPIVILLFVMLAMFPPGG